MKPLDYIILSLISALFTLALTYIIYKKRRKECIGCEYAAFCSRPGDAVSQKEIGKTVGENFGVCRFSELKDILIDCRKKELLPENAKSVITFVFPYKVKEAPPENISRYAAVPDYHIVCGEILSKTAEKLKRRYKGFAFVPFCDNSPINEVAAAVRSGLGVKGGNGLLITEKYGSFVFIGEIVTDMCITPSVSGSECDKCGECKKHCPVGLDKSRCLSALTQKKGELNDSEKEMILNSGCVWGCDICSDVCPLNKNKELTPISEFKDGYKDRYTLGEDINGRAYAWRGEKVITRNAGFFGNNENQ